MDAPGAPQPPSAGGPPPTPFETRRPDRRAIVWSCVAAVVLAVPTIWAAAAFIDVARGLGDTPPVAAPDGDRGDGPERGGGGATGPDVEVPQLDLSDLSGTDAAFGRLLTEVDRSESAMLRAQQEMGQALAEAGPDADPDEVLARISAAAGDGQRELQELRSDLAQPLDDDDAAQLRDLYLSHLDAWVRYLVAIERDAEVLLSPDAGSALTLAIDTTGYAFADELRDGLPEDLDDEVAAVARAIADRGFPERDGSDAV